VKTQQRIPCKVSLFKYPQPLYLIVDKEPNPLQVLNKGKQGASYA